VGADVYAADGADVDVYEVPPVQLMYGPKPGYCDAGTSFELYQLLESTTQLYWLLVKQSLAQEFGAPTGQRNCVLREVECAEKTIESMAC
jgi:hypothetical protein